MLHFFFRGKIRIFAHWRLSFLKFVAVFYKKKGLFVFSSNDGIYKCKHFFVF